MKSLYNDNFYNNVNIDLNSGVSFCYNNYDL